MERIMPLTELQLNDPDLKVVLDKTAKPGRFMCQGKSVNICTGHLVGGNIIYQIFYWDRPMAWFQKVRCYLQANNPNEKIRVEYSE